MTRECRRERVIFRPLVLKITRSVLTGYENSLLYLIHQPLTRNAFWSRVTRS